MLNYLTHSHSIVWNTLSLHPTPNKIALTRFHMSLSAIQRWRNRHEPVAIALIITWRGCGVQALSNDLWTDTWSGVKHLTEIVELFYSPTLGQPPEQLL